MNDLFRDLLAAGEDFWKVTVRDATRLILANGCPECAHLLQDLARAQKAWWERVEEHISHQHPH